MLVARGLFVLYALLVTFLSLLQGDGQPGLLAPYDKIGHFMMYALFAILAVPTVRGARSLIWLLVAIVVYSALLEFAQSFVPGRQMSIMDILANMAGVYFGWRLQRLWRQR